MSRILLFDQESSSLGGALAEAGFSVRREPDGKRIATAVAGCDFDAAVIDTVPTDVAAERLAQELRARDPELPIFVCTNFDEEAVTRWAVEDRMLVLEKPVDEARLVWLLKAHVGIMD